MRRIHGRYGTKTYRAWANMKARCRNPKNRGFAYYGRRGISVHPAFETFNGFLAHLGECPPGMTLDRIDNDGDYAPGNVRWATKRTQMANRSDNRIIIHEGVSKTLTEWGEQIGITAGTLWARLELSKWEIGKALTEPLNTLKQVGLLGAKARWG